MRAKDWLTDEHVIALVDEFGLVPVGLVTKTLESQFIRKVKLELLRELERNKPTFEAELQREFLDSFVEARHRRINQEVEFNKQYVIDFSEV